MSDEEEVQPSYEGAAEEVKVTAFLMSESIKYLAPAMLAAQQSLENPEKNAKNPHFGNRYADLGASMAAALKAYHKQGISITQVFAPAAVGTVALTTLLMHKSGEWIGGTCTIPLDRDNAQGYGSAATYARRYGIQAITGMVAEDDDDGNGACAGEEEEPEERPRKAAKKKGLFGRH